MWHHRTWPLGCLLLISFISLPLKSSGNINEGRSLFPRFMHKTVEDILEDALPISHIGRPIFQPRDRFLPFGIDRVVSERVDQDPKRKSSNSEREFEGPDEDEYAEGSKKEVEIEEPSKPSGGGVKDPTKEISLFTPLTIPFSFAFGLLTPWWKGPNVCVERNEVDEPEKDSPASGIMISFESTQCMPTDTTYICTRRMLNNGVRKTIIVRHQCCHGFVRKQDGSPGCTQVKMVGLEKTLRDLEATKFADMMNSMGVSDKLKAENLTIFAPTTDAITDFEEETENNEIVEAERPTQKRKEVSYFILGHTVDGFVNLDSVESDHVLPAMNGKTTIRINKYRTSSTVVTANCIPVASKNNFALNGIVHIVSDVLPLPRRTVVGILEANERFSIFYKLLSQSSIMEDLKDSSKSWTLFAPSDAAFNKMDADALQRLLSGEGCVDSILRNHILKGTVCSSAIERLTVLPNLLENRLFVVKDKSEKLSIGDVSINNTDIVGTNGVIHYIDEVMIPHEARSILERLKDVNREDIIELFEEADLISTLENAQNITMFVPSSYAIRHISNETRMEWKKDSMKLKDILLYHIAVPKLRFSSFRNAQELPTLAGDHSVRLQMHEEFPRLATATAQCSLINMYDYEVCGAVMHVVDKLMQPPEGNIVETLKGMKGHDKLIQLLEATELELKLSKEDDGYYTFLAPTDAAFEKYDEETMKLPLTNKTLAEQILRMHVIPSPICCSSVANGGLLFSHRYVSNLEGYHLSVRRGNRHDNVRFGPARTVQCDIMAQNGIIHSVNRIILPTQRRRPMIFNFGIGNVFDYV